MSDDDCTLDCRGMRCPLPMMYARKALAGMPPGAELIVITTDPGSAEDFDELVRRDGARLVEHREDGGDYLFLLRKDQ